LERREMKKVIIITFFFNLNAFLETKVLAIQTLRVKIAD